MRKSMLFLSSILLVSLFFVGCSPDKLLDQADDTTKMVDSATDFAAAESAFEVALDLVEEEAKQQGDLNGFVSNQEADDRGCAEVAVNRAAPGEFPVTMTLDFGDNCTSNDGHVMSGKIKSVFTGKLRDAGSAYTVTFENFVLDGRTISGSKTVTNNGPNGDGQLHFTISLENGLMIYPNEDEVRFVSERTRTWIAGQDTKFESDGAAGIQDDVWEIEGTASGKSREGNSFSATITSPLRSATNCRWLTAGVIEVDLDTFEKTIGIDFGDGACDDTAEVTVGLIKRGITLR